jgi:hypothetical protein
MSDEEEVDMSRTVVKTFIPAYQKEKWKRHAEELDMSQSEFVRTMVQAGRRDFEFETMGTSESESETGETDGDGEDLEEHVLSVLSTAEHLSWDDLLDRLTNSIEDRLEETLQQLQTENRVQYSGRRDGYTLVAGNDGD